MTFTLANVLDILTIVGGVVAWTWLVYLGLSRKISTNNKIIFARIEGLADSRATKDDMNELRKHVDDGFRESRDMIQNHNQQITMRLDGIIDSLVAKVVKDKL